MKTRKFLWAVLPMMAAALVMTACGGDDDTDTKPVPVSPTDNTDKTEKSIPYTVTVKGDPETTRATVNADGRTMNFADGDKLYVKNDGDDIHGVLFIQSGAGSDAATFSGTLYYDTTNPPSESTILTATLVSSNDKVAVITDGKVTGFTYPTTKNVCSTLADAVSKYSQLTGTGNYGSSEIELSQTTAFLKFTVTLEDGTIGGASVPVSVTSNGSATIGTGTASTSGSNRFFNIQTVFYVPVAGGTVITKDASMCVANVGSDNESITYGASTNKKLIGGKVYTVSKTKDFVRLWAGGPVWSTRNLGASSVTDYGNYYAWGETKVYPANHDFGWTNYTHCNKNFPGNYDNFKLTKYNKDTKWGKVDNNLILDDVDDAATQSLGSSWCMPPIDKFTALLVNTNTTNELTTVSGVKGKTFTGNTTNYTGKAIFLPATGLFEGTSLTHQDTGYYWSSMLNTDPSSNRDSRYADVFTFTSSGAETVSYLRCYGRCIRPVRTN